MRSLSSGSMVAGGVLLLVLVICSFILSGRIFEGLVGIKSTQLDPQAIITYWTYFGSDDRYLLSLVVSSGVPLLVILVIIGAALFRPARDVFGGARFAKEYEIQQAGLRSKSGVLLGKKRGRFLCASGQLGALVFAPPRSGKGVGFCIPNMLNWSGSAVVTDIKQEIYEATAGFRAKYGQEVFLFSPLDESGRTHRYNPLTYAQRAGVNRLNEVQKISEKILPTPRGSDPMWSTEGRDLLEGLILLVLDTDETPTLGEVLRLTKKTEDFAGYLEDTLSMRRVELDAHAVMAFTGFLQKSSKEQSGVLSTVKAALALWSNPLIDGATSASDFDPSQLRAKPMTIYVGVSPDNISRLSPLINIFLQQTFDSLLRKLPDGEPYKVLAILDEFTALGRLNIVEKGIAYFAGYNITLAPIIQDIAQLEEVYGKAIAKTFLSTAKYRIAFAQNCPETAEYISRQLGTKTIKVRNYSRSSSDPLAPTVRNVSTTNMKRELMLPHEVMQLRGDREIVLVEANLPVLADKIVYYQDRAFRGRVLPAPSVPRVPGREALSAGIIAG